MDEIVKRDRAPAGWEEALAISEAQADAGETVSADVVRQHLREGLARLEARLARRRKRADKADSSTAFS